MMKNKDAFFEERSCFKVWPGDVEEVLYRHPKVHQTGVAGYPDDYYGEIVKAFREFYFP